jgi:predicted nucleotidyltransferase
MKSDETVAIIQENRKILKDHHVKSIYLFGSIVRGEDKPGSDIDIMVEFQPDARVGLFGMARLQRQLSVILSRSVDLTTRDALPRALRDRITREAVRAA